MYQLVWFSMVFLFEFFDLARIFQGEEAVQNMEKEIRDSRIYQRDPTTLDNLINLKTHQLQQYVRSAWMSNPLSNTTESTNSFMDMVIKPSLDVNLNSIPENFTQIVAKFGVMMTSGNVTESEAAKVKVAIGALDGRLDSHPFLHGLSLQCLRLVDKENRNITTMAGRRDKESEKERQLIADAGLSLALASGNRRLAQQFLIPCLVLYNFI